MAQSRKLAAIMFTDIVGYTAIMGESEQRALELLVRNREIQKPIIEQNRGRWIKELGDGVMASFNSISDAVQAAIAIQQACNASGEFQLRIGIHLGEVVTEDNDVFGDGVNIASRIQALAPPGGIWISEAVHQNVANKQDIHSDFVRQEHLKNVKDPIRIFQIRADGVAFSGFIEHQRAVRNPSKKKAVMLLPEPTQRLRRFMAIGTGSLMVLMVTVYLLSTQGFFGGEMSEKSIAVLAFEDMSAGKDQGYLSDGLSEEIINALAQSPDLKVIARTSSFQFKGKQIDLRKIGEVLGVAAILEGSVRKESDQLRITVQLIETSTGTHLWASTFNRKFEDILKVQDEIAQAVALKLRGKLQDNRSKHVSNPAVHSLLLQARYHVQRRESGSYERALSLYEQALAIDSLDASVWSGLSYLYFIASGFGPLPPYVAFAKMKSAADRALQLDQENEEAQLTIGAFKRNVSRQLKEAAATYHRILERNPGNTDAMILLGALERALGHKDAALKWYKAASQLDPINPSRHEALGTTFYLFGDFDEALGPFQKALELQPSRGTVHTNIAMMKVLRGEMGGVEKELELDPSESSRSFGWSVFLFAKGSRSEADSALIQLKSKFSNLLAYQIAQVHSFRGEADSTFHWLELALGMNDQGINRLKIDPFMSPMHKDPRWRPFLESLGVED